jgi:hypothetical protein
LPYAFQIAEKFICTGSQKIVGAQMPFWNKNKPSSNDTSRPDDRLVVNDPLVSKLVSDNSADFTSGLQEAVNEAEAGDCKGIEAMREAIQLRSGKKEVTFYEPGLRISSGEDFSKRKQNAPKKILELAKSHALLKDPYYSEDLITAVMSGFDSTFLRDLVLETFKAGGTREAFNFQLLYNEIRCTAKLNSDKANGILVRDRTQENTYRDRIGSTR